jgi:pyruvate decarboxylase
LGVDIARREIESKAKSQTTGEGEGRTILITGDGSMALTIQEIGTMIKAKCKTIVFVINNDGYTVERLIWGAQQGKPRLPSLLMYHLFFCLCPENSIPKLD